LKPIAMNRFVFMATPCLRVTNLSDLIAYLSSCAELSSTRDAIYLIGTMPVLQLGNGEVIDESLDNMHWALQQHDPKNWLKKEGQK